MTTPRSHLFQLPVRWLCAFFGIVLLSCAMASCGDDNDGSAAQQRGVGDACSSDSDCIEAEQTCLRHFKGGYCGLAGCNSSSDCPAGSACIRHSDDQTYCFLNCRNKAECNLYRPAEAEANCSANVEHAGDVAGGKACVPPSG